MRDYAVSNQARYTSKALEMRCYFGKAPTLEGMNAACGDGSAEAWLKFQLADLGENAGARTKLTEWQLNGLATLVAQEYGYLRLTEIMLFCRKFKCGRFGSFYGSIDPIRIMGSLAVFVNTDRAEAHRKHEQAEQEAYEREYRKKSITYEEYEKNYKR